MPKIPPPILSLIKIQIVHLILDGEKELATKIALVALLIEKGPELINEISKLLVEGDAEEVESGKKEVSEQKSLGDRIVEALESASNYGKIYLLHNTLIPMALTADFMNEIVFLMIDTGFQKVKVEKDPPRGINEDYNEYWFRDKDIMIESIEEVKFFQHQISLKLEENESYRKIIDPSTFEYIGEYTNDEDVEKYIDLVFEKLNPIEWIIQIYDFVVRLIIKIRIFISEMLKAVALFIRAQKTGIQIGEDTVNYVSDSTQTVLCIGAMGPAVSTITV